ncbi:MAG: DUF6913 domain-containing protein [Paludibacteraceae bacterium]
MNLKEKIYSFVARRQPKRDAKWPHWESVKQVLVLYESDLVEKNPTMRTIRTELQKHKIDAVFWGYVPKKEVQSAVLPQSRIVGMKDFNCFGYPRKELVQDLQQQRYDLVIDLNQSDALPLRYLCLLADAGFKSGMAPMEVRSPGRTIIRTGKHSEIVQSPCDLQINTQPQETPEFLFQQILHYLTNIQSND